MEYNREDIANRIFMARKNKGLKQIEVCNYLNICQSVYSDIETGKRDVTLPVLFSVSSIFDISVLWLLGVNNTENFTNEELILIEKFKKLIISARK